MASNGCAQLDHAIGIGDGNVFFGGPAFALVVVIAQGKCERTNGESVEHINAGFAGAAIHELALEFEFATALRKGLG